MSMPAIFFTAGAEVAKTVHLNHTLPEEDIAELSSVDTLKLSTLWAIIEEKTWDVDMMDAFEEIYTTDSEWLYRIPDDLTKRIALLEESQMPRISRAWAETEEMSCEPAEAAELLRIMAGVATRSLQTKRHFYLYTSL